MEFVLVVLIWIVACLAASFLLVAFMALVQCWSTHRIHSQYPYWLAKHKLR